MIKSKLHTSQLALINYSATYGWVSLKNILNVMIPEQVKYLKKIIIEFKHLRSL